MGMKDIAIEIGGIHRWLTSLAQKVYADDGEVIRVYQSTDGSRFLFSVDGVPQSPWMNEGDMQRLLSSNYPLSVENIDDITHFENEERWQT